MLAAMRSTILSRRSCEPSGSAITSRNCLSSTRGPLIAVVMAMSGRSKSPASPRPRGDACSGSLQAASGVLLVETVIRMQRPDRKFGILVVDQHRGLDLGSGDQLDVDALVGERPEHRCRNARMVA